MWISYSMCARTYHASKPHELKNHLCILSSIYNFFYTFTYSKPYVILVIYASVMIVSSSLSQFGMLNKFATLNGSVVSINHCYNHVRVLNKDGRPSDFVRLVIATRSAWLFLLVTFRPDDLALWRVGELRTDRWLSLLQRRLMKTFTGVDNCKYL